MSPLVLWWLCVFTAWSNRHEKRDQMHFSPHFFEPHVASRGTFPTAAGYLSTYSPQKKHSPFFLKLHSSTTRLLRFYVCCLCLEWAWASPTAIHTTVGSAVDSDKKGLTSTRGLRGCMLQPLMLSYVAFPRCSLVLAL